MTAGTFLGHVCPAVGCPGRNSQRPGLGCCRRSIGERKNWLLPLSYTTVQVVGCCPGVQALTVILRRRRLYPATSTHNHSVSDCSGDWSTSDHSNRSWTNVARPWFLLRIDPASDKLEITILSAVVQWVSSRTMMKALLLQASCSMTEVLFAVIPSVFSWSMLGHGSSSAAASLLPRLAPGVPLPIPRWTHPAREAVLALVVTG